MTSAGVSAATTPAADGLPAPDARELRKARWRDEALRMQNRILKRRYDAELLQLRQLERAYAGSRGPEVLVLGDSGMVYVPHADADRRRLAHMVRDQVPSRPSFLTLAGPGYNPRIVMAFLAALERLPSRPRVVVVPAYPTCVSDVWLAHPTLGYEHAADQIRQAVEQGGPRPRRLVPPSAEVEAAYDELPAPSFDGYPRSAAELRLMTNAPALTKPQREARKRHLMDSYYAQRLELDGLGPTLITQMGAMVTGMGLRSLSYTIPLQCDVLSSLFGAAADERVQHNAEVLATAYKAGAGDAGVVVDATYNSPSTEFCDPIHLNAAGRRRLAPLISSALIPLLAGDG